MLDLAALDHTLSNARRALLDARGPHGHWEGELSSSALSTATAVFALHQIIDAFGDQVDPAFARDAGQLIRSGLGWLSLHQNADGGWGDTTASFSNISTTCLCWAAFVADENWAAGAYDATLRAVEKWLIQKVGTLDPARLAKAIAERYGKDHTFSVPILTMCALAGRLGLGKEAWDLVPALPFELAAFPQRWFKWLKLPVVSYALPALIAIGQVGHYQRPTRNAIPRFLRDITRRRTLKLLKRIQPTSGGYLEATPLTSFVMMSLASSGQHDHPVVERGITFLKSSVRPDGSWPIDTNLATWVTTLSVNALANESEFDRVLPESERKPIREWLLAQQYRKEHPYTLANPGGWAWTDLPGGVPDADDTPGAILALRHLGKIDERITDAATAGLAWLFGLQNRDGGIPTFCKGWGTLPFDKSSADLTAHTLRACAAWPDVTSGRATRMARMVAFLEDMQAEEGAWRPLWFGNQHADTEESATYGTSRVLLGVAGWKTTNLDERLCRAVAWLLSIQNGDGGWGGDKDCPSTIEETALALEGLANLVVQSQGIELQGNPHGLEARVTGELIEGRETVPVTRASSPCLNLPTLLPGLQRGVSWLIQHTQQGTDFPPTPIGFYFAKLWYWEKLYPLVWTVSALGLAKRALANGRNVETISKSPNSCLDPSVNS